VQQPLPTRRQLREAAALREAERLSAEPAAPSPVYAMGPAVSATQQPQGSFSAEQFRTATAQRPAEQITGHPAEPTESPAISTVAAMTIAGAPVRATHTFVPAAQASAPVAPVAPRAVAPAATPVSAPVTASVSAPIPTSLSTPLSTPASAPASLSNGPAYQPFGMTPKITTGTIEAPTSVNTLSVWLITLLPAVALGVAVALIRFAPDFYTPFTQGALAFVFAIAGVALAVTDRKQLTLRSHQAAASPAWILLTPLAYLVARAANTKRQAGRGWAPALVFVLLTAGAVALVYFSGLPIETFVVV
jgi:ribonuclease E